MAYSAVNNDSTQLRLGDNLKVTVGLQTVPFIPPGKIDLINKLNESGKWVVQDVQEVWTLEAQRKLELYGVMVLEPTVGELKAEVANALNFWNTWSVHVEKVEIAVGFRPEDLVPSTSTAVTLAAIAIIAVIGFVAVKGAVT